MVQSRVVLSVTTSMVFGGVVHSKVYPMSKNTAFVLNASMVATMRENVLGQISNARKKDTTRSTTHCNILHPVNLIVVVPARVSLIEVAQN